MNHLLLESNIQIQHAQWIMEKSPCPQRSDQLQFVTQNPQAIIIAHTTEYIPRLVHMFGSDNGTLTGYVNKTLTGKLLWYFSIPLKHLQLKKFPPPPQFWHRRPFRQLLWSKGHCLAHRRTRVLTSFILPTTMFSVQHGWLGTRGELARSNRLR